MMIETNEPLCEECEIELTPITYYDIDDAPSGIIISVSGKCPICLRKYKWKEHYAYCGFSKLIRDRQPKG